MPDSSDAIEILLKQRRVLADFGDFAQQSENLDEVLTEACRLVGEALGTGRAKVLEIEPGGESLFVRAGVGWAADVVGQMHISMSERSSESFSIEAGKPVITDDISKEERFNVPDFMKDAGVVALANVPIFLLGKRAYGLLQVDDTVPRDFDENDTEFLRTYATLLGPVIDRLLNVQKLQSSEERFRLTVEAATDYAIFTMDAQGRITDWLPGAATVFGWSAEEAVGQSAAMLFTPEDREEGADRWEIETARREGRAPDVRWHLRKDGSRVFIEGTVQALHDVQGALVGFLKLGQDVTERHESEARLAAIFANASVGLSEVGLGGQLLRVNDELCRIMGRSREELLELSITDVTHPEDLPRTMGAFGKVLQDGGSAGLDKRYIRPDGSAVWANSHGTLMQHNPGHPDTLLVVTVDLTARREAEEALRQSEERYRAIVETVSDYAIFTTDAEGRIETWPPGAQKVFGWSAEEAEGQLIDMTFTPEDRAIGAPETERMTSKTAGYAPDVRWHLRSDGSRIFIDGASRPLTGPDGTLTGFVKVGQDVTDRRATETALRESEERFRQFGEASSDVLWIRDAETLAYEYLSPAYEAVYGSSREEALRGNQVMRWMEAVHPDDRDRVLDLLRHVRAGENAGDAYRVIRHSDGEVRWIRNTDFPLYDTEGRVQRIGGISHDATEQVEARERLEVLVTELQHRTRNLIAVVSSIATQTMAHTGPTEAFREEFSHRLAALSRVQGLLSRAQQDPITLRALLKLELDALAAPEGERVWIEGPFVRIRPTIVQTLALVVHELATNARKYGALSGGGGRLRVVWRLQEDENERRVFIEWREEDLSPADAASSTALGKGGYGRRLIERALPYSLGAQTTYELGPTGLRCTIDLPLDREPEAG